MPLTYLKVNVLNQLIVWPMADFSPCLSPTILAAHLRDLRVSPPPFQSAALGSASTVLQMSGSSFLSLPCSVVGACHFSPNAPGGHAANFHLLPPFCVPCMLLPGACHPGIPKPAEPLLRFPSKAHTWFLLFI